MDMLLMELLLWGGLFFLFWALKDALGSVETDIDAWGVRNDIGVHKSLHPVGFTTPDEVADVIGSYRDAAIYRYVRVGSERYTFDHIQLVGEEELLLENERCVAPGLVYVRSPQ